MEETGDDSLPLSDLFFSVWDKETCKRFKILFDTNTKLGSVTVSLTLQLNIFFLFLDLT